jgi:MYXO-CTERM domain-containing protein
MTPRFLVLTVTAAMGIYFGSLQPGNASILHFDDLSNFQAVPNGYGGLNWNNFLAIDKDFYPNSGYDNGNVSSENTVFNDLEAPAYVFAATASSTFTFNGAYLTGAWNNNLQIEVRGYLDGNQVITTTVIASSPSTTSPTFYSFNYSGIDQLEFISFGGTDAGLGGGGTFFAMDNFTFNEPIGPTAGTPEPASLAIWGLGALGVAAVGRARRRKA